MSENSISDELVFLHTNLLTVTIKGSASHPAFPGVEFKEKDATIRVSCDDPFEINLAGDPEIIYEQSSGKATWNTYKLLPLFFEQQRYELIIEPEDGHSVEFRHENYNIRKNVTPVGRISNMLSGIINFGNDIGMSDLIVAVDGKNYLKLTLEVFPSKISYKDDYKAIISDVTAEVYNLVFDFLKKAYMPFGISPNTQPSPVEFFAIIRKIYNKFLSAADMVIAKPHHILETEHVILPEYKIKRTDNKTLRWIEKHPDRIKKSGTRIIADHALSVKKYVTYDTKENRLTKYILQCTVKRLESFRKQYLNLYRDEDQEITDQLESMIKDIQRRYSTSFLKDIDPSSDKTTMSLVFSMAPGYRDLYRCYLLLQHGLSVTGSVFNMSEKDLAVLYEYWCFIKLNSLMKKHYELISQDIVKTAGNGLFVTLVKGQQSSVRYRNPENGEEITLSYNPKEISGATVPQQPDNVLSLKKTGAKINYEYVFDAKYKINPALNGSSYQKMYTAPGPQEEDINTMHRYRDAIVYQSGIAPFERTMFGAYVLFPYKNQEEYRNHRFYKSIEQVNIGGLPFLPTATDLVTEMLDELISDSPESAFERAPLPVGIENKLAKVDWNVNDVMVGTFRSEEQFNINFKEKFYYVPKFNVADNRLPIRCVALYRQKAWCNPGIKYYGEVVETSVVKRKDIHNPPMADPKDAEKSYYYFKVKEWKKLSIPIEVKGNGPRTLGYTNFFLLTHCRQTFELFNIHSEEEYRLVYELRRIFNDISVNDSADGKDPVIHVDENNVILARSGNFVLCNSAGDILDQIGFADFARRPKLFLQSLLNHKGKTKSADHS